MITREYFNNIFYIAGLKSEKEYYSSDQLLKTLQEKGILLERHTDFNLMKYKDVLFAVLNHIYLSDNELYGVLVSLRDKLIEHDKRFGYLFNQKYWYIIDSKREYPIYNNFRIKKTFLDTKNQKYFMLFYGNEELLLNLVNKYDSYKLEVLANLEGILYDYLHKNDNIYDKLTLITRFFFIIYFFFFFKKISQINWNFYSDMVNKLLCGKIDHIFVDFDDAVELMKDVRLLIKDEIDIFSFSIVEDLGYMFEKLWGELEASRKKTGSYYTPHHIVSFIVKRTIYRSLHNSFYNLDNFSILDPTCGVSHFLINAFMVLHEEIVQADKFVNPMQCIFGWDINPYSVFISRLQFAVLSRKTKNQLDIIRNNIKCVDTLKYNPQRKFQLILGNPPYGVKLNKDYKHYLTDYELAPMRESTVYFLEKGLKLLGHNGNLAFVLPKSLTYVKSWAKVREFLLNKYKIKGIVDLNEAFEKVLLEQIILFVSNDKKREKFVEIRHNNQWDLIDSASFSSHIFFLYKYGRSLDIANKIEKNSIKLGDVAKIWTGASFNSQLQQNGKYVYIKGGDLQRYTLKDRLLCHFDKVPANSFLYEKEKVIVQDIVAYISKPKPHIKLTAKVDIDKYYNINTITNIYSDKISHYFIVALLNSRLINWYVHNFIFNRSVRTMHFRKNYADYVPILLPNKISSGVYNEIVDISVQLHDNSMDLQLIDRLNTLIYNIFSISASEQKYIDSFFKKGE